MKTVWCKFMGHDWIYSTDDSTATCYRCAMKEKVSNYAQSKYAIIGPIIFLVIMIAQGILICFYYLK
jgi:hypothetical protein